MKAAALEDHFSPEEIDILDEITATQKRAELSAELPGGTMENPYSQGMRSWVERKLSSNDADFMAQSLTVAAKYDGIDKDRELHRILIARTMQR